MYVCLETGPELSEQTHGYNWFKVKDVSKYTGQMNTIFLNF